MPFEDIEEEDIDEDEGTGVELARAVAAEPERDVHTDELLEVVFGTAADSTDDDMLIICDVMEDRAGWFCDTSVLTGETVADTTEDVAVVARIIPAFPLRPTNIDGLGGALRTSSGRLKVLVKKACLIPSRSR